MEAYPATFSDLFAARQPHHVKSGTLLINAYDENQDRIFYIKKGYVKTYDIGRQGDYQLIGISAPGEVFPLLSVQPNYALPLYYETMAPTDVCTMSTSEFQEIIDTNAAILKCALEALLHSYRFSQQRIRCLEFRTARERVAYILELLANYYGKTKNGTGVHIQVPIRYQDIADASNLTRDTVNRIMREFVEAEFVHRDSNGITIKNMDGIQQVAQGT